jgi:hypothetical protein
VIRVWFFSIELFKFALIFVQTHLLNFINVLLIKYKFEWYQSNFFPELNISRCLLWQFFPIFYIISYHNILLQFFIYQNIRIFTSFYNHKYLYYSQYTSSLYPIYFIFYTINLWVFILVSLSLKNKLHLDKIISFGMRAVRCKDGEKIWRTPKSVILM